MQRGAAGKPVPFQELSQEVLVASLQQALTDKTVAAAKVLGERLAEEEDGKSSVARAVLSFLDPIKRFVPSNVYNRTDEQILASYPKPTEPVMVSRFAPPVGNEERTEEEQKEHDQAPLLSLEDELPRCKCPLQLTYA